jgi:hypothetical protein
MKCAIVLASFVYVWCPPQYPTFGVSLGADELVRRPWPKRKYPMEIALRQYHMQVVRWQVGFALKTSFNNKKARSKLDFKLKKQKIR